MKKRFDCGAALPALTLALLALAPIGVVQADVSGTYQIGSDEQFVIHYRDDDHIRFEISMPEHGDAVTYLMTGGKTYMVAEGEYIDMAQIGGMLGGFMNQQGMTPDMPEGRGERFDIHATGRMETHAGLDGEVHEWREDAERGEVVLSEAEAAQKLTRAWIRLAETMITTMGLDEDDGAMQDILDMRDHPALRGKGILASRVDGEPEEEMKLVSYQEASLPDSMFRPSRTPTSMPAMPFGGGQMPLGGMPDMNDPAVQEMMRGLMQQIGQ